jgi:hypothetical protein
MTYNDPKTAGGHTAARLAADGRPSACEAAHHGRVAEGLL